MTEAMSPDTLSPAKRDDVTRKIMDRVEFDGSHWMWTGSYVKRTFQKYLSPAESVMLSPTRFLWSVILLENHGCVLEPKQRLVNICGERMCIAPAHHLIGKGVHQYGPEELKYGNGRFCIRSHPLTGPDAEVRMERGYPTCLKCERFRDHRRYHDPVSGYRARVERGEKWV